MKEIMISPAAGVLHGRVNASFVASRDWHIRYLSETRGLAEDLLKRGMLPDEILSRADAFPRFADDGYERLHAANINSMINEVLGSQRGGRQ